MGAWRSAEPCIYSGCELLRPSEMYFDKGLFIEFYIRMFKLGSLCLPAALNLLLAVIMTIFYAATDTIPSSALLITAWILTIFFVYVQYKLCKYGENFLSWMVLVVPNVVGIILLFTPAPNGTTL